MHFTFVKKRGWLYVLIMRDMIRAYSQMHRTDKYSQFSSIIWSVWPNGWVFVYELSGCGFKSRCSHLKGGGLKNFYLERGLDRKEVVNFCKGFRVSRDNNNKLYNFTSQILFDLPFTSRMKDVVSLVIFHICFELISFH